MLRVLLYTVLCFFLSLLSQESLVSFQERSKNKGQRAHIMGRIYFIDVKTASLEENPYNLAYGTEYFVCYIEPLKRGNKRLSGALSGGALSSAVAGAGVSNASTAATATAAGAGNGTATPTNGSPEGEAGTGVGVGTVNTVNTLSLVHPAEGDLTAHMSGEKVR